MNEVTIREVRPDDEAFLEMLVQAVHMAVDGNALVEAARQHPYSGRL